MVYGGLISVSLAGGPVSSSAVLPLPDRADGDDEEVTAARPTPTPLITVAPSTPAGRCEFLPRREEPITRQTVESGELPRTRTPTARPTQTTDHEADDQADHARRRPGRPRRPPRSRRPRRRRPPPVTTPTTPVAPAPPLPPGTGGTGGGSTGDGGRHTGGTGSRRTAAGSGSGSGSGQVDRPGPPDEPRAARAAAPAPAGRP